MAIGLMHVIRENICDRGRLSNCRVRQYYDFRLHFASPSHLLPSQVRTGIRDYAYNDEHLNNEIQEDQITKTEVLRGTLVIRESTAPQKFRLNRIASGKYTEADKA